MTSEEKQLVERIERLEAKNRRMFLRGTIAVTGLVLVVVACAAKPGIRELEEVKTRRLIVVDDQGTERVVIGQDAEDTDRVSRACGITLHDESGTERGGMGTMDDGSVVFALDAPAGVGSPMRDRVGIKVYADGRSAIWLIDNQTKIPVRLVSEPEGGGGIEFFDYDLEAKKLAIKRIGFDGESKTERSLGGN